MKKINLMKRTGVVVLALCMGMAVLFTGCKNKKNEGNGVTEAKEEQPVTTVEETTAAEDNETTENNEVTTKEDSMETTTAVQDKNPMPAMEELYNEIVKSAGINGMYQLYEEDLLDYYGIDVASDCKDYVFYQSEISPGIDTVALFVCKDKNSAKNVAEGLQVILDSLKDSTKDYAPEEYDKALKAEVKTEGNFAYLIVCENISAAEEVINQY